MGRAMTAVLVTTLFLSVGSAKATAQPLHDAAAAGDLALVEALIEEGASLDALNVARATALHLAVAANRTRVVEALLDGGAWLDVVSPIYGAPLHVAAERGSTDMVVLLLERGAEIDQRNPRGFTPLISAAAAGRLEAVQYLISRGACVDCRAGKHFALMSAAINGHADVARALLDAGAFVNQSWDDGTTPLHEAIRNNEIETVELLIEFGADLDKVNEGYGGAKPLQLAERWGHDEIAELLAAHGATD